VKGDFHPIDDIAEQFKLEL